MIVFRTFLKILKQNLGIVMMYVIILVGFTSTATASSSTVTNFSATKPDIAIINQDTDSKITKNLIKYIENNANIIEIEDDEQKLSDALFYRDVDAILYIYEGYTNDYLNNQEKKLDIRLTTDYDATYTKMLFNKYFKIADIANNHLDDIDDMTNLINASLATNTTVTMKNSLDTDRLDKVAFYYNFANYSILAICIYVVALLLYTFHQPNIKKRNLVSSKKISVLTKELYLSNLVLSLLIWLFVVLVSFIILGDIMFTMNGLFLILNSLVFTFTALSIGFLIGNILKNKEAINGIMNVIALGSSFLCGCFIPIEYMPKAVVTVSKVLPSYWYIANNNLIKTIENFNMNHLQPVLINMLIVMCYGIVFFSLAIYYNKKKNKI